VFVHSTLIAKGEILREFEVILAGLHDMIEQDVLSRLHVKGRIKETICATLIALEAFRTLPLTFRDKLKIRSPAE
jgi:hypothetical protein